MPQRFRAITFVLACSLIFQASTTGAQVGEPAHKRYSTTGRQSLTPAQRHQEQQKQALAAEFQCEEHQRKEGVNSFGAWLTRHKMLGGVVKNAADLAAELLEIHWVSHLLDSYEFTHRAIETFKAWHESGKTAARDLEVSGAAGGSREPHPRAE